MLQTPKSCQSSGKRSYLELEWRGAEKTALSCSSPMWPAGLRMLFCLWSLGSTQSHCPSALWPLHKSHCEGQLVQGEWVFLHFTSPHLETTPVLRVIPQTQEREVPVNSLELLFLQTHMHRQTLCTWHKQPNLIQTTGWANSSHPAEAHKPETRALQQEMGHAACEGSFKCGLLPSTLRELRKQISNIHWRSAVPCDYRASQAEVMSELGAVIIPLSLGEIYSGPSEKTRQDCVTWLAISFKKKASQDQDGKWIWQCPGQTQCTILALSFLLIITYGKVIAVTFKN